MMDCNRLNQCRVLPRQLAAGFIMAAFLLTAGSTTAAPLLRLEVPSKYTFQETLKRLRTSIKQNRMGLVNTKKPEETEFALMDVLPRKHWIGYNDLLVRFGQMVCKPISPRWAQCPLDKDCPKIGVGKRR